ncbi:hypothetical protein [Halosegnis longus]|uniref:hypothetical protein n=1 Tax=Halosegnis longus TaxID=2216012 RepID=UPI00129E53C3|nr:hypothetical protein [Halosegnis longus]
MVYNYLSDLRAYLIKQFGRPLARKHEKLYVETTTDRREYVGTVKLSERETIELLQRIGCEPNYLAAFKTLEDSDVTEIGSWVWRGSVGDVTDPSTYEQDTQADMQLHLNMFEVDGEENTTAIYGHWEYSWLTHPVAHYRGAKQLDAKGARIGRELLKQELGDKYSGIVDEQAPEELN